VSECQGTAGFLFRHRCGGEAVTECLDCGKAICHKHAKGPDGKEVCVQCARGGFRRRKGRAPAPRGRSRARDRVDDFDDDDPFFYGVAYYDGYGHYGGRSWGHEHYEDTHDVDDFTEADAAAFDVEQDTDYEHDMGAS